MARNRAYGRVGHLYVVDIPNVSLNIRRGHALGVHGQEHLLDVLTDAGLVSPQHLRLKFALTIPGHGYPHIAEAGAQRFAAVPVPAVVRVLSLGAFSSGVRFFLAIVKPPVWCFYYTPHRRLTQSMGWARCSIATEVFSTQAAKPFTANGLPPICGRVCHASADALTTVPWRGFGVCSNLKYIISEGLLRVTI